MKYIKRLRLVSTRIGLHVLVCLLRSLHHLYLLGSAVLHACLFFFPEGWDREIVYASAEASICNLVNTSIDYENERGANMPMPLKSFFTSLISSSSFSASVSSIWRKLGNQIKKILEIGPCGGNSMKNPKQSPRSNRLQSRGNVHKTRGWFLIINRNLQTHS